MDKIIDRHIKIGDVVYVISSDDKYLEEIDNDYEPNMVQLYRTLITHLDVVADIGANIGLTSILFSSIAKFTYAFEPCPSTYLILNDNLARNSISNVDTFNFGFGNSEEKLSLTFANNNRSGGYVSDKIRPVAGHFTENIHITKLDTFFKLRTPAPTILKIDVEGYEQSVIKGGWNFLHRAQPVVIMEMNHFCLNVLQRITLPDFLDFVRSRFPYLYAVDNNNRNIINLHIRDQAYMVMHEHVVNHRFPNLVGGFDESLKSKLEKLEKDEKAYSKRIKSKILSKLNLSASKVRHLSGKNSIGKIQAKKKITDLRAGELADINVVLINESTETWDSYSCQPVFVSYHWENISSEFVVFDGIRTPILGGKLSPGTKILQSISVSAPDKPGKYKLVVTLVKEGFYWFEDRGFNTSVHDVCVL